MPAQCLFCDNQLIRFITRANFTRVECPGCGLYNITPEAFEDIRDDMPLSLRQKSNISGWLHDNQKFIITTNNHVWLKTLLTPSFHDRADKVLLKIEKNTNNIA